MLCYTLALSNQTLQLSWYLFIMTIDTVCRKYIAQIFTVGIAITATDEHFFFYQPSAQMCEG